MPNGFNAASPIPQADVESTARPESFFHVIEDFLGLKLVPAKGPVEVIVIDSVQRPTED